MNQRVENELRSILDDLDKIGLLENELISDCLKKEGIRIPSLNNRHLIFLTGLLIISLGYYGFFYAGVLSKEEEKIFIKRNVPASVGRDNTLYFPAQVQIERDGRYVERWHWDYGEYGELNGFIHRFECDTEIDPLTVTCYRQGEKFESYNPTLKPLPRSLAFIWSSDQSIHYGVLDEESRNHGLWIKFEGEKAVEAVLWNKGRQVGLSKVGNFGQWKIEAKVKGFDMPRDPIADWHKINDGYFDINYAMTLIDLKHDKILYAPTLGKLIDPLVQKDKAAFQKIIDELPIKQKKKWTRFVEAIQKSPIQTQSFIKEEWKKSNARSSEVSNVKKNKTKTYN